MESNRTGDAWLPGMITRLKQLDAQGYPYSRIAQAISIEFSTPMSRSAIAGMVRRLGLPKRGPPATPPFIASVMPPLPPMLRGYTLLDLQPHECKWPVEYRDGMHHFCREPRLELRPYCADHVKLAYVAQGRRASAAATPQTPPEPTFFRALY